MKPVVKLPTLIAVFSLSCAGVRGELAIEDKTPLDGWVMFQYQIEEAQIAKTPKWDPLSGKPLPLSAEKALLLARKHLKKNVKDLTDYEVTGIELKFIYVEPKTGADLEPRWYWRVFFGNHAVAAIGGVPLTTEVVVLLDGWSPSFKKVEGEDTKEANQAPKGANRVGGRF